MLIDILSGIINDLTEIEKHDVIYEAIQDKLNKSLRAYVLNIDIAENNITDISDGLKNEQYFNVVRMIARRINL